MLFLATFFILGTIVASFGGVVAERLNTGEGFLGGRSRCNACNRPLAHLSLVPIVSYFLSVGYARCCGSRLSFRGPCTEALLGVLFALSYQKIGLTAELFFFLLSLSVLLPLVLYDLAHQILPPSLLVPFVLTSALAGFFRAGSLEEFAPTLFAALLIAGVLALIHFLSRGRAMGFADIPLSFSLALLVGERALSGFIFSFWIGAVVGIVLLSLRPRGSRIGIEVPFAPFLAAGFLLAYFTQWNPFVFAAALP